MSKKKELENIQGDLKTLFDNDKILDNDAKKLTDKVDTALLRVTNYINRLNRSQRFLGEWVEALNFLHWFNWNKMYSKRLIKEAKEKLHSELEYTQSGAIVPEELEWDTITIKEKEEKKPEWGCISADSICTRSYCDYSPNYSEIRLGNKTLYLEDPTPKYEYKDYVKAVVAAPYKYDKKVCYNVYRYLKEILAKDQTVKDYDNSED